MEAAAQAFLVTLGIAGGILSPIILILILTWLTNTAKVVVAGLEVKATEVRKRPPFTDVEVNVNPATNVMTARFIKDGQVIWQGSSSRRAMEESDILEFNSEDIK